LFTTERIERFKRILAKRLSTDTYVGLHLTVSFVVLAGAIWISSTLLDAILNNEALVRWDVAAAAWIHSKATPTGTALSRGISKIGSPTSMGVIAVIGGVAMLMRRRKTLLVAWVAAFAGGGMLEKILKTVVHRTRPLFNTTAPDEQSLSFPSGHSMMCLIGVGMLVYVAIVPGQFKGARRTVLIALAAMFVLLMGISRVYLGAHFPSDVVGGFAAGAGWIAICVGVRGIVKHRSELRRQRSNGKPRTTRHAPHTSSARG
jgi:membrane-associated phospholipid phosphatase